MYQILFFSSLCVMFCQTAEVNTLKPWGLSPVNWSKRGQIRRAQCPPGTGGGKADLRCPIQGSGQVILVPWQCDNLKLYRQKFASECSQPHRTIYPPSDFCHGLSGRWCSSSELPIVSVGAPTGVLGHAHMRWLFMHMGFPLSREVCWGGAWHLQRFPKCSSGGMRCLPEAGQMGHVLP